MILSSLQWLHLVNCFHHPFSGRKFEKSKRIRDELEDFTFWNKTIKVSSKLKKKMTRDIKSRVGWFLREDLGRKLRVEVKDNLGKILLSSLMVTETSKDFQ